MNDLSDGSSSVARPSDPPTNELSTTVASVGAEEATPPRSFKAELIADDSGMWASTGIRLATVEEATSYARFKEATWILVRKWRVTPTQDPVNAKFEQGRLTML